MKLFKKNKQNNPKVISNNGRQSGQNNKVQRVFSYYTASRRQLDSIDRNSNNQDNSINSRRISKIKRYWFVTLVIVVLIVIFGYLSILKTSAHVVVAGQSYRSINEYQKIVDEELGRDKKNRFKLLLKKDDLQNSLKQSVPEAKDIIVRSTLLGHRPEIIFSNSKALAMFIQKDSDNYILSDRGRILLPTKDSKIDTSKLPVIVNQTGIKVKAGEQFMSPDEAQSFNSLIGQYNSESTIVQFTLNNIPHELIAKETGRGYYVKYLLNDNILQQFGAVKATQKKLQEIGQNINEYIDARLAERIYYK